MGGLDGRQERGPRDGVTTDPHEHRLAVVVGVKDASHRLDAARRRHPAVVRRRRAAPLYVAEDRDPGLLAGALPEHPLDPVCRDGRAVSVRRAFGNHQDRVPPSGGAAAGENLDHAVLPPRARRRLRQEGVVRAAGDRAHERQIAAVAAHHLDDERAPVGLGRRADRVDRLGDAVQRGVRADGHVRADHVVVDGSHQPGDVESGVCLSLLGSDPPRLDEFGHIGGPGHAQVTGPRQRAVTTDDDQPVDAALDEILGRGQLPLAGPELH